MADSGLQLGKHFTRREEITEIMSHGSEHALSEVQKLEMGAWLEKRMPLLKDKVSDSDAGVTKADVVEAYASAKWGGTKFLYSDMKMLKEVAAHFDQLALAGPNSDVIDKEDVRGLKGNARVTRNETEVTSQFPDGSLYRRMARGDIYQRGADGSIDYDSAMFGLKMDNKTGKGTFEIKTALTSEFGGMESHSEPMKVDLERHSDGTWWGQDPQGNEMQLAIDDHSVRVTMHDMDMMISSKGGFMRDPTDPNFAVYMNADGSTTVVENGQTHDLMYSEDGVRRIVDGDGTNWFAYPMDPPLSVKVDPDKSMHLNRSPLTPKLDTTAHGTIKVTDSEGKETSAKPASDGTTTLTLADGSRTIVRDKSGNLKITIKFPDGSGEGTVGITTEGVLTISSEGGSIEVNPPEIRRPK